MIKTWLDTDSGYKGGYWKNKRSGRRITGHYRYCWQSDSFEILINKGQLCSGARIRHISYKDEPSFENWEYACEQVEKGSEDEGEEL